MVTIKEVAKKAGVSHGTVSNVINGLKNVSVEKIQKVENAMKELGYSPNVIARNLKSEKTRQINLVLPNIRNLEYAELYENLNRYIKKQGYSLDLRLTNEIPTEERRILNDSLMHNVEGVILVTCQPENEEFFNKITKNGLKIVFIYREISGGKHNFIGIDAKKIIESVLKGYFKRGTQKIAIITGSKEYSFECDVLNIYFSVYCEERKLIEPNYIEMTDLSRESAFRAGMRLLSLAQPPEVILVSNAWIADGVKKAISILYEENSPKKPEIAVLKPYDWTINGNENSILLPFYRMASEAFDLFMQLIDNNLKTPQRIIIKAENNENVILAKDQVFGRRTEKQETLRILLNKSPSSEVIRYLLPDLKKKTGIKAEITEIEYENLFDEILKHGNDDKYDIVSVDLPWLSDLADMGLLLPLDELYNMNPQNFKCFNKNVLKKFSKIGEHYFAVPYSFTIQLLFYRKDLFAKLQNQRMYYEWYKQELEVPKNWDDFNKVAKFFTRKYNSFSDTEYGITLGGRRFSGAMCEFSARMFGYGGKFFDAQQIAINSMEAIKALDNYIEGFNYAPSKATDWWWNEQVETFSSGEAAMMVMFSEHVATLNDRRFSEIVGKTDSAILPGKYSVLGGWSLGINAKSKNVIESYEFLKWVVSGEVRGTSAALGRIVPIMDAEYRALMEKSYPWFETACEAYNYLIERKIPVSRGTKLMTESKLEEIVGGMVHEAVCGRIKSSEALELMAEELIKQM